MAKVYLTPQGDSWNETTLAKESIITEHIHLELPQLQEMLYIRSCASGKFDVIYLSRNNDICWYRSKQNTLTITLEPEVESASACICGEDLWYAFVKNKHIHLRVHNKKTHKICAYYRFSDVASVKRLYLALFGPLLFLAVLKDDHEMEIYSLVHLARGRIACSYLCSKPKIATMTCAQEKFYYLTLEGQIMSWSCWGTKHIETVLHTNGCVNTEKWDFTLEQYINYKSHTPCCALTK